MDQELKKRYDSLPQDIRSAIDSADTYAKLQSIGKKHNLLIDKVGDLTTAVGNVMLGLLHPDDFVTEIETLLEITAQEAIEITTEVNIEIFVPLRESLMKINPRKEEPLTYEASKPRYNNIINPVKSAPPENIRISDVLRKTDILGEIENPKPSLPMIPVKSEPDVEIKRGPQKPWENAKQQIAQNFIGSKLSGPMNMPIQRTQLEEKKPEIKTSGTSSDPYREPAK